MTPQGEISLQQSRKEIAQRVRQARRLKGWTQVQAADLLGCSRRRINIIEQGGGDIWASELALLAQALDIPVEYFFKGNDQQLLSL